MKTAHIVVGTLLTLGLTGTVSADWDPGDPFKMHFPQLPDLTSNGLDVFDGPGILPNFSDSIVPEKFLADDWMCTESGPVTGIHFWGSYLFDQQIMASMDPDDSFFSLVIYEDIPETPTSHSRPGEPLWDMYAQPTNARLYADNVEEGFYDPNSDEIVGSDTQVWQFNFDIPAADAFVQSAGEIYWLGIHHTYDLDGNGVVDGQDYVTLSDFSPAAFGWKTSQDHFNDDGVWTDVSTAPNVPGDYDGDGFVGAGDLALVLNNWGDDVSVSGVPVGWVSGLPMGMISSEELQGVLGNWGNSGPAFMDPHVVPNGPWNELIYPSGHPFGGQSMDLSFVIVPEPSAWLLLLLASGFSGLRRRRG